MLSGINRSTIVAFIALCCGFGALGLACWTYQRTPRIGYVDANSLLNAYQGMIDARKEYAAHRSGWQRNLDTLKSDIQRHSALLQQARLAGQQQHARGLEQRLQLEQEQFVKYRAALEEKNRREQVDLTQSIVDSTNRFLQRYGDREGYEVILMSSDNSSIAYVRQGVDITNTVVHELNQAYSTRRRASSPGNQATNAGADVSSPVR